jgi:hypothetical protein
MRYDQVFNGTTTAWDRYALYGTDVLASLCLAEDPTDVVELPVRDQSS